MKKKNNFIYNIINGIIKLIPMVILIVLVLLYQLMITKLYE